LDPTERSLTYPLVWQRRNWTKIACMLVLDVPFVSGAAEFLDAGWLDG
jgi:hypothetical protein